MQRQSQLFRLWAEARDRGKDTVRRQVILDERLKERGLEVIAFCRRCCQNRSAVLKAVVELKAISLNSGDCPDGRWEL